MEAIMLNTLLGGFLALLGGCVVTYIQLRYARKTKMNEIIAEKKVNANSQAYSHMKEIQSQFSQLGVKAALKQILSHEEWFFNNRLFLPGDFSAKWLSARNDLLKLSRREGSKNTKEIIHLDSLIENTCKEALLEIFKDMNIKPFSLPE